MDQALRRRLDAIRRGCVGIADTGGVGRLDTGHAGQWRRGRPAVDHRAAHDRTDGAHLRPHEVAPGGEKRLGGIVTDGSSKREGQAARIACAEWPAGQHETGRRLPGIAKIATGRGGHPAGRAVGIDHADDERAFPQGAVIRQKRGDRTTGHRNMSKDSPQRADGITCRAPRGDDHGEVRDGPAQPARDAPGRFPDGDIGIRMTAHADRHFQLRRQLPLVERRIQHGGRSLRPPCQGSSDWNTSLFMAGPPSRRVATAPGLTTLGSRNPG